MAGKKAKPRKTVKKIDFENLKPSDVLCPICRSILIEPVSLSCNHAFCKLCFEGTMENANLVCPLCRVRVGSWFRKAKKEEKLVDERLWEAIQAQYPAEVQNRYQGIDNVMEADVPIIVVASPGEIRKEYEQQRQREIEEQKKIREAEEKASAPLIKKLREEEEYKKNVEEEKLRLDAALARKLAEDLEKPTTSKFSAKKISENRKADGNKKYGPMDKFIRIEEIKPNRIELNESEERKKLYKGGRKRISTTPNPASDFATKEYTCHVLNAESHSKDSISIFNKSSHNKQSATGEIRTVEKKIRLSRKNVETERRKSICKSGYKSSESGSDDTIDQECKFYFKPIDTQRRHHLPGTIPVKVPSVKVEQAQDVYTTKPSGKIVNLQLGTVISAFARFSRVFQQKPQSLTSSSRGAVKDEMSNRHVGYSNRLKRKLSDEQSPVKKKGKRQMYTKKNLQYTDDRKTISSPFYGFDNESARSVNSSPFYGFDTLEIKESNREKDTIKKLIATQEPNIMDNKSLVKTQVFYKTIKTYSRHQSRQLKELSDAAKSTEEPLKLRISKTPKNGINMSEAIKNKLAELRSSLEGPSDLGSNKPRTNIDINRNIPKPTLQPSGCGDVDRIRSSWNANCTDTRMTFKRRTSLKNVGKSEDEPARNESTRCRVLDIGSGDMDKSKTRLSNGDNNKSSSDDLDLRLNSTENDLRVPMDTDAKTALPGLKLVGSKEKYDASNPTSDSVTKSSSKPLKTSSSPKSTNLNGFWRTRNRNGSPRKARNSLSSKDSKSIEAETLISDGTSPFFPHNMPAATASTDSRLDDTSSHPANKTYQSRTKNAVFLDTNSKNTDTNSKITDTFFKVKSSPTKSKNSIRKLKLSPAKTKLNNNIDKDLESVQVNGEIEIDRRQMQEQFDFEMAKKLQAEFDSIQTPSRTRRGTKRQITLDEMLAV